MAESDAAAIAALMKRLNAVELPPAQWTAALETAERVSAVARAAAAELPFHAEPSGFALAVAACASKGGRHG